MRITTPLPKAALEYGEAWVFRGILILERHDTRVTLAQSGRCHGTLTIMIRCLPLRIRWTAIISGRWLCRK